MVTIVWMIVVDLNVVVATHARQVEIIGVDVLR